MCQQQGILCKLNFLAFLAKRKTTTDRKTIAQQDYAKRRFYSLEVLNKERNTWPTFGSVAVLRFAKKWDVICIIRTTVVNHHHHRFVKLRHVYNILYTCLYIYTRIQYT